MNSSLFTLNPKDWLKGLALAVITAIVTFFYELINAPEFDLSAINWPTVGKVAVGAAISYIVKNLLTNNNDQLLKKDA